MTKYIGMSPEAKAKLDAEMAKWTDWEATCRVCHTPRKGSLAELKRPCPNCGAKVK